MILSTAAVAAMNRGVATGIFPRGVPPPYSWYQHGFGPVWPCRPPAGWTQGQMYIHAFPPDDGSMPTLANMLVRNPQFWIRKNDKTWVQIVKPPQTLGGGWFQNPITPANIAKALPLADIGNGIWRVGAPNIAFMSHFWPGRGDFASIGAANIDGLFITWEVALDGPGRICIGLSNDWWSGPNGPAPTAAGGFTNNAGSGSMDWQVLDNVMNTSPTKNFKTLAYTNFTQAQLEESLPPYFAGNKNGDGFVNPGAGGGTIGLPPPPPPPIVAGPTILAPAMSGTEGRLEANTYNMWTNGSVGGIVKAAKTGTYRLDVTAHGSVADAIWPSMDFSLDGVKLGDTVVVNGDKDGVYSFVPKTQLTIGDHDVRATFLNDGHDAAGGDRNLYVTSIALVEVPPVVVVPPTPATAVTTISISDANGKVTTGDFTGPYTIKATPKV